ncbi:MAG TPA: serine--tRNA ligase, partial [Opitutus sp.]|nr:serine--tRNA ligase [Opitutus sp.]
MLDAKLIRETPDLVRAAIAKKHLEVDLDRVIAIDAEWRSVIREVETLRAQQKAANTAMAALPKGSPEFTAKVAEMKSVSQQVKERDGQLKEVEERFRQAMLSLPNLPHASVPEGRTPEQNVVYATNGDADAPRP